MVPQVAPRVVVPHACGQPPVSPPHVTRALVEAISQSRPPPISQHHLIHKHSGRNPLPQSPLSRGPTRQPTLPVRGVPPRPNLPIIIPGKGAHEVEPAIPPCQAAPLLHPTPRSISRRVQSRCLPWRR